MLDESESAPTKPTQPKPGLAKAKPRKSKPRKAKTKPQKPSRKPSPKAKASAKVPVAGPSARTTDQILADMAKVRKALSKSEPRGAAELAARSGLDRMLVTDAIFRIKEIRKHGDKRGAKYTLAR